MPHKDITRLREITKHLPAFPEATANHRGWKRHRMHCGTSLSWELDPDSGDLAACAKWYNSMGTEFPEHVHPSREWVIVIEGSMYLTVDGDDEKRLLPGMSAIVEPNVKHSARFLEDCWYYAITIPRDPGWPSE